MEKKLNNMEEKVRHLLMTLEYPPNCGGVGVYLHNLVENSQSYDFKVLKNSEQESCSGKIIESPFFYKSFWPKWLKSFFLLKKYKKDFSVLHISHILPLGYIALLVKKLCRKKYVVYLHGLDFNFMQKSKWKRYWGRKILKNANIVIANSKYLKKEVQGFIDIPVEVVYPIPNLDLLQFVNNANSVVDNKGEVLKHTPGQSLTDNNSPRVQDDRKDKVLLTVGRLVKRKGHALVIEAIKNLNYKYFIVGRGPEKENLLELIKKYNLEDRVFILDNIKNNNDLAEFYKKADLFIMPTLKLDGDVEGFGIVYLEANAFGLSVIAGQGEGVLEAVENNKTGIVLENPQNIESLKEAIENILENDNLREDLSLNAKKHYLKFLYEGDHLFNKINKYL